MATFEGLKEEIANLKAQVELRMEQFALSEKNLLEARRELHVSEIHIATLKEEKGRAEELANRATEQITIFMGRLWQEVLLARVNIAEETPEEAIAYANHIRQLLKDPEERTSKPEKKTRKR